VSETPRVKSTASAEARAPRALDRREFLQLSAGAAVALTACAGLPGGAALPADKGRVLDDHDAVGLAELVRDGEISAQELTELAIARIEARNPALNAVIRTRFDQARDEVKRGLPDGPFRGVPFLVKELGIDVAGLPTAGGCRLMLGSVAKEDSELTRRYRSAGLVILGQTNTPELGKNASTEPTLYGPTHNPWRRGYSPGGSSGGSAAAVAAGMLPAAHGNDGGGSIRIPSSMCGLFGLKPSRMRTPAWPRKQAFAYPLAINHALTRTVRDSAALLDVAAGPLPGDPYSVRGMHGTFLEALSERPRRLRIGWSTASVRGDAVDAPCAAAVERAVKLCGELGHELVPAQMKYDTELVDEAQGILGLSSARAIDARLAELGRKLAPDDVEPFTRVLYEASSKLRGLDVIAAFEALEVLAHQVAESSAGFDLMLTPTLARRVPEHGVLDTRDVPKFYKVAGAFSGFTAICNITGQPAMSIPMGADENGLPTGAQFIAPLGQEALLLKLAAQLEVAAPWAQKLPGGAAKA
jgi:amidase